jgi:hypothetical protein
MLEYIDILTLGVNRCVNVVAHVAHYGNVWIKHSFHYILNAVNVFGLNTFHYITCLSHAL